MFVAHRGRTVEAVELPWNAVGEIRLESVVNAWTSPLRIWGERPDGAVCIRFLWVRTRRVRVWLKSAGFTVASSGWPGFRRFQVTVPHPPA